MKVTDLILEDQTIITSIYEYRCLTKKQIKEVLFLEYEEEYSDEYIDKRIQYLLKNEVLKEIEYKAGFVYFLNMLGIKLYIQIEQIATDILDLDKQKTKKGYTTASKLQINPVYINHQVHTNQFIIDFKKSVKDINYRIMNEQEFAIKYGIGMRPDGVIQIGNLDLFIETDMGTESSKQLNEKWDNYRMFLNSPTFTFNERNVLVLFLTTGIKPTQIQSRINLVKKTIYDSCLDKLDINFDIVVGTFEEIINYCVEIVIPSIQNGNIQFKKVQNSLNKFNITSNYGEMAKKYLMGDTYLSYSRMIGEDNKVIELNNKKQIYLVEDYTYSQMSVIKNIYNFRRNSDFFKKNTKNTLTLIVIVQDMKKLYNELKLFNLFDVENVVFTTYDRLNNIDFLNTLFTLDENGNVYEFLDYKLEKRVYKEKIIV